MSNFTFLQPEWSFLYEAASKAEGMAKTDARTSCFYARRTLELAVSWLYIMTNPCACRTRTT